MRRRLLLIGIVLGLGGWIGLAARGAINDTVIEPILYAVWVVWQVLDSLPQAIVWGGMLLLLGALALRALLGSAQIGRTPRAHTLPEGRIEPWRRLFRLAQRDRYSRWRAAHRLATMVIEQVSLHERIGIAQARRRIENGELALPPDVLAFLQAGLAAHRPDALRRGAADPLAIEIGRVVAAIDALMEQREVLTT
jgi:hypothetical protein